MGGLYRGGIEKEEFIGDPLGWMGGGGWMVGFNMGDPRRIGGGGGVPGGSGGVRGGGEKFRGGRAPRGVEVKENSNIGWSKLHRKIHFSNGPAPPPRPPRPPDSHIPACRLPPSLRPARTNPTLGCVKKNRK